MGGASSSAGAGAAGTAGASSVTAQQLAQRQALASGVTDGFGKIGDGFANQKTAYSPEMNNPVFANQKYKFGVMTDADLRGGGMGVMTDADLRGGGMYSGTNFSNPTRRGF
jgi:hypothetical protein